MRIVTTHRLGVLTAAAVPALAVALAIVPPAPGSAAVTGSTGSRVTAAGQQAVTPQAPLVFTPNEGQAGPGVRYLGQGQGVTISFTRTGVTLDLAHDRNQQVTLQFRGASPHPRITGAGRQPETVNYFLGSSPARWHAHIASYATVVYRGLWPGVTAAFTARDGTLRYAFTLAAGARAAEIRLGYAGARRLMVGRTGVLNIATPTGVLRDQAPATTQTLAGRTTPVASRYRLAGRTGFGFTVGRTAPGATVTIDPGLEYSSYLGGSCTAVGWSDATDAAGDQYVFGQACSANFPTTPGAYQRKMTATVGGVFFVTKFNPAGTGVIYSTFVGGTSYQEFDSGVVDSSGAVYVTGQTGSADFPTTAGAFRRTAYPAQFQSVVFKLSPDGSRLEYSTYLAPNLINSGWGRAISLAPGGSVIVAGYTSSDFAPTTPGAFQPSYPGGREAGYAARLNATGSRLIYGTYLGAPVTNQSTIYYGSPQCTPYALATDNQGDAYIAGPCVTGFPTTPGAYQRDGTGLGTNGVLVKLDATGTRLDYATYYGTPENNDIVDLTGVAVDRAGDAYISAEVTTGDAPSTPGALASNCTTGASACVAVAEFNPAGTALVYSTCFGGDNYPTGVAVDSQGHAYVVGDVLGGIGTIPTTADAYSRSPGNFSDPFFLAVFGPGNLLYSSYFGGAQTVQVDGLTADTGKIGIAPEVTDRTVYLSGFTAGTIFPVTPGAFQTTNPGRLKQDVLDQSAWAAKLALPAFPPSSGSVRSGGQLLNN
jgi:hypothetical protein